MEISNVYFLIIVFMCVTAPNIDFYNGRVSRWITSNEAFSGFKSSIIAEDTSAGKIEPTAAFVV